MLVVEFPAAHSQTQRCIMECLTMPGVREVWVACGTKFGKTAGAAVALHRSALATKNGVFRWVAPIYEQAKIGMRYAVRMLPDAPFTHVTDSGMPRIAYPQLGTIVQYWHGRDPVSLEGEGVHGYVLDECAKMSSDVYTSVRTTLTQTRGPILGISTPYGKGWFYERCMIAREEMAWALRHGKTPSRIFLTAPTAANPYVAPEAVADAQRSLPARLFAQYYLAQFVNDGSVFTGQRDCMEGPLIEFESQGRQCWIDVGPKEKMVVVGVDWAKTADFTVFTAWEVGPRPQRVVGYYRSQGQRYTAQIKELVLFCRNFGTVLLVRHDKTGVGQAIDDMLAKTQLPYEGVTFTNKNKGDMVGDFIMALEQKAVRIPHMADMVQELDAYEVRVSPLGAAVYGAPSGLHDDIITSLFLGYSAVVESSGPLAVLTEADAGQFAQDTSAELERWYREIGADDED